MFNACPSKEAIHWQRGDPQGMKPGVARLLVRLFITWPAGAARENPSRPTRTCYWLGRAGGEPRTVQQSCAAAIVQMQEQRVRAKPN